MKKVRRLFNEINEIEKLNVVTRSKVNSKLDTHPKRVARGDLSITQIQIRFSEITYDGALLIIAHLQDSQIVCESDKVIRRLYKNSEGLRSIRCHGGTVACYQL